VKTGLKILRAPAQGTPLASAGKNQMSREQLRAKIGALPAVSEGETAGEIEVVPAVAKTQTTTAGTGGKIWF
jgi:hypothetical protein